VGPGRGIELQNVTGESDGGLPMTERATPTRNWRAFGEYSEGAAAKAAELSHGVTRTVVSS
jgi:hypothetical protein